MALAHSKIACLSAGGPNFALLFPPTLATLPSGYRSIVVDILHAVFPALSTVTSVISIFSVYPLAFVLVGGEFRIVDERVDDGLFHEVFNLLRSCSSFRSSEDLFFRINVGFA